MLLTAFASLFAFIFLAQSNLTSTPSSPQCPAAYTILGFEPKAVAAGASGTATMIIAGPGNPGGFAISLSGVLTGNSNTQTWNNFNDNPCASRHSVDFIAGASSGKTEILLNFLSTPIGVIDISIGNPAPTSEQLQLQAEIKQIQDSAPKWIDVQGGDPRLIQSLGQALGDAISKGDITAAKTAADKILGLISKPPAVNFKELMARLQQKVADVQKKVPQWINEQGGNPRTLQPFVDAFSKAISEQRLEDAEKSLDQILDLVAKPPAVNFKDIQKRIQEKVAKVQSQVGPWIQSGGDPSAVAPFAQSFGSAMEAGNLEHAEQALDKILAILAVAPSGSSGGAVGNCSADKAAPYISQAVAKAQELGITLSGSKFLGCDERNTANGQQQDAIPADLTGYDGIIFYNVVGTNADNTLNLPSKPGFMIYAANGGGSRFTLNLKGVNSLVGIYTDLSNSAIAVTGAPEVTKYKFTIAGCSARWSVNDKSGVCSGNGSIGSPPSGGGSAGKIAFVSRRDGTDRIYLMDSDGTNVVRLTSGSAPDSYPSWSPDGSKIVFERAEGGAGIYIMNADGSNVQRLSGAPPIKDVNPTFSPDGARILFVSITNQPDTQQGIAPISQMMTMNVDGTNASPIFAADNYYYIEPRWSPDGSKVVFMSNRGSTDNTNNIFIMNADGTNIKQLTKNQGQNGDPVWSPDGRRISFGSNREGNDRVNIFVMNPDGSGVTQLTHFPALEEAGDTSWSPDGKKITFQWDKNGNGQSDPNAYAEVWTMNADGTNQASTKQQCSDVGCAPRWQPQAAPPPPSAVQYLLFQLFTFGANPNGLFVSFSEQEPDLKKTLDEILAAVQNQRGDGNVRQLGFSLGPLALDMPDGDLRDLIQGGFKLAEEKNIAVAFHIDDSMFWFNRRDLWSDKNNVEWTDWDGTIKPHRIISWAAGGAPVLAPPMCYNSPAIKAEITRIARSVIGAEIKKGIDHLNAIGKSNLFAGVIAGWETRLDDDSQPPVKVGYCALHNLGYSAQNPPKDFNQTLDSVLRDWIQLWTKSLNDAGVPATRIYTHVFPDADEYTPPGAPIAHAPSWVAFNNFSHAGFSIYGGGTLPHIISVVTARGNLHWAMSEGTNVYTPAVGVCTSPTFTWQQYLDAMFGHGASLVNIFAWTDTGSCYGKATRSLEAIAAYKKFLSGE